MLISEPYRAQQLQMHDEKRYGKSGGKWWGKVVELIDRYQCKTWLDYGCGTGKLGKNIRKSMGTRAPIITEYDPGVRGKDVLQVEAGAHFDLVTCIDVMEHIEPWFLRNCAIHLHSLTGKVLFVVISTRAAGKTLPDGRNAHINIRPPTWWATELPRMGMFQVEHAWQERLDELSMLLRPAGR